MTILIYVQGEYKTYLGTEIICSMLWKNMDQSLPSEIYINKKHSDCQSVKAIRFSLPPRKTTFFMVLSILSPFWNPSTSGGGLQKKSIMSLIIKYVELHRLA